MGQRRMLTVSDRVEISTGLKAGWSIRAIAVHLNRAPSVVSREIRRNSTRTQGYRLVHADVKAERARGRPQVGKVAGDPVLTVRVLADLRLGRSPRAIAGRLAAEADDPGLGVVAGSTPGEGRRVSHPAVYSYVYALPRAELIAHGIRLDSGRVRRKPRKTAGKRAGPIIGMVSIDDRPEEVADRKVPGHWESQWCCQAA